jgi:hypothetical protein
MPHFNFIEITAPPRWYNKGLRTLHACSGFGRERLYLRMRSMRREGSTYSGHASAAGGRATSCARQLSAMVSRLRWAFAAIIETNVL